jgi:hypothetical protein
LLTLIEHVERTKFKLIFGNLQQHNLQNSTSLILFYLLFRGVLSTWVAIWLAPIKRYNNEIDE